MDGEKTVCQNRRARHDYHILETFEAGLSLTGAEVKSLREGRGQLADSYAVARDRQLWLINAHISPYSSGGLPAVRRGLPAASPHLSRGGRGQPAEADLSNPRRSRKLLMHKREIIHLERELATKGLTLIPLRVYFKRGRAKVEIALARGKRLYDKREAIKRRDEERAARGQAPRRRGGRR